MLNMGSEKYDISKKNQDFNLIVSKFIGHPMHRQIISGMIENHKKHTCRKIGHYAFGVISSKVLLTNYQKIIEF